MARRRALADRPRRVEAGQTRVTNAGVGPFPPVPAARAVSTVGRLVGVPAQRTVPLPHIGLHAGVEPDLASIGIVIRGCSHMHGRGGGAVRHGPSPSRGAPLPVGFFGVEEEPFVEPPHVHQGVTAHEEHRGDDVPPAAREPPQSDGLGPRSGRGGEGPAHRGGLVRARPVLGRRGAGDGRTGVQRLAEPLECLRRDGRVGVEEQDVGARQGDGPEPAVHCRREPEVLPGVEVRGSGARYHLAGRRRRRIVDHESPGGNRPGLRGSRPNAPGSPYATTRTCTGLIGTVAWPWRAGPRSQAARRSARRAPCRCDRAPALGRDRDTA